MVCLLCSPVSSCELRAPAVSSNEHRELQIAEVESARIGTNSTIVIDRVRVSSFPHMADYFSELGFRPLGEGETPDHAAHLLRLLRDSGNFELLQMMLEGRASGGNVAPAASKEVVKNLPLVDPPTSGKSDFSGFSN